MHLICVPLSAFLYLLFSSRSLCCVANPRRQKVKESFPIKDVYADFHLRISVTVGISYCTRARAIEVFSLCNINLGRDLADYTN